MKAQDVKNGAGLGYMQNRMNEVFGKYDAGWVDLVIDGLYGSETRKGFAKLFKRELISVPGIDHFRGIDIFQAMYQSHRCGAERNLPHLFRDGKWGRETKIVFDMLLDKLEKGYESTVSKEDERVPFHNSPEEATEGSIIPEFRIITSTPYAERRRYDGAVAAITGVTGSSIEGLLTTNTYTMLYLSPQGDPQGGLVFNRGSLVHDAINVTGWYLPDPRLDFECYDRCVSNLLALCKRWGAHSVSWHTESKHIQSRQDLIQSLKAYGFSEMAFDRWAIVIK